jgi:hypothetical protein
MPGVIKDLINFETELPYIFNNRKSIIKRPVCLTDNLCDQVSDILSNDPEVPGSIARVIRFSEEQWVWKGVQSAS